MLYHSVGRYAELIKLIERDGGKDGAWKEIENMLCEEPPLAQILARRPNVLPFLLAEL